MFSVLVHATLALTFCSSPPVHATLALVLRSSPPRMSAEAPRSSWDVLRYGHHGARQPTARSLAALFSQLDRDENGSLSVTELKHGLKLVGFHVEDYDKIFSKLDADSDGRLTLSELEMGLPAELRTAIDAQLNKDGKLDSLYLPPEEWQESASLEELRWEQKVQMQAQKNGNGLKQNDILNSELGKM